MPIRLATLEFTDDCADLGEYRMHLKEGGVTALDGLYMSVYLEVVNLVGGAHECHSGTYGVRW